MFFILKDSYTRHEEPAPAKHTTPIDNVTPDSYTRDEEPVPAKDTMPIHNVTPDVAPTNDVHVTTHFAETPHQDVQGTSWIKELFKFVVSVSFLAVVFLVAISGINKPPNTPNIVQKERGFWGEIWREGKYVVKKGVIDAEYVAERAALELKYTAAKVIIEAKYTQNILDINKEYEDS